MIKCLAHISIHALLAESDFIHTVQIVIVVIFLSTLSLRRATCIQCGRLSQLAFLSTLSLRRATSAEDCKICIYDISIHALLAESDVGCLVSMPPWCISIHALLAESDWLCCISSSQCHPFLSTLSLRRATSSVDDNGVQGYHFYPRSPCGERRLAHDTYVIMEAFLSTLSLRRATYFCGPAL